MIPSKTELLNFPCTAAARGGRSPPGGKEGDVLTIGQPSEMRLLCRMFTINAGIYKSIMVYNGQSQSKMG